MAQRLHKTPPAAPAPPAPSGRRYAPRLQGGKRLNLIQARLNDEERARLDALKAATGLTDSDAIRLALDCFAGGADAGSAETTGPDGC